jgi:hypothetical protein
MTASSMSGTLSITCPAERCARNLRAYHLAYREDPERVRLTRLFDNGVKNEGSPLVSVVAPRVCLCQSENLQCSTPQRTGQRGDIG